MHVFVSLRPLPCAALLCLATLLWVPARSAHADVYAFVAEDGSTHFSDSPNDPRYQLLLRVAADPAPATLPVATPDVLKEPFAREIAAAAHSSQVEPALLHAVIAVESNYNPRAVSRKGAQGLMQLMPATARSLGVADPLNAAQNIRGGAQYLRALLDRFANNKSLALAAYNAGAGAVVASGGQIPPYAETRAYVPAVLRRYQQNLTQLAAADKQSNSAE
ncbi:transglycosylase [Rhodoferax lacus]|uniref:Transglycosylase n=1 Tax=Rhodoferax lacus TaxID=2184758 RepID=A0A3E1R9U2_9BURK|nr:lytic transglycosylase domain-containing protein [Rhodoferax lacus]RFO95792.1 transglycosylase [Rhodoferax lacus]